VRATINGKANRAASTVFKTVFNRLYAERAYVCAMKTHRTSVAGLLILLPAFTCLVGCAQQGPRYAASSATSRPTSIMMAQEPNTFGGGEAYQGYHGHAVAIGSAPALNDTGSERIPDYPAGAEPAMVTGGSGVIMPNGGETIVQSANSLPD
jgi:hypothetical protein